MEPPWLGLYVVVVFVGAMLSLGWVSLSVGQSMWRQLRDRQPVRRTGPAGEFIHIPALNVRPVRPGRRCGRGAFVATRFQRCTRFRISAGGVEYGWSRRSVTVPFRAIELVDTMPSPWTFSAVLLRVRGEPKAIAVLTTSARATRHALWLLAHHCPITDRARLAIGGDQPPAPTAVLEG